MSHVNNRAKKKNIKKHKKKEVSMHEMGTALGWLFLLAAIASLF